MHFFCTCGKRITDSTDFLPYKARLISDQDWDDFWDIIAEAFEKSGSTHNDKEETIMDLMMKGIIISKTIYQCTKCGNLFISGNGKNGFKVYKSSSGDINNGLLESYRGEQWEGFLHADWSDKKPEWQETNGNIFKNVNFESSKIKKVNGYNNWENLEKDYFILFNEFKEKGIIRSSLLKKNNEVMHSWHLKNE